MSFAAMIFGDMMIYVESFRCVRQMSIFPGTLIDASGAGTAHCIMRHRSARFSLAVSLMSTIRRYLPSRPAIAGDGAEKRSSGIASRVFPFRRQLPTLGSTLTSRYRRSANSIDKISNSAAVVSRQVASRFCSYRTSPAFHHHVRSYHHHRYERFQPGY